VLTNRTRTAMATFVIGSLIGGGLFAANAHAESGTTDSSNSLSRENDSVNVTAAHHYNSPAERANDALMITEVKSALANDGVANNYPVAVDCDHGKVLLSGVVKSAGDAKHAGDIAAAAHGVTGVKNQLTWH
jgi:osmotically-inducible protein OsmY